MPRTRTAGTGGRGGQRALGPGMLTQTAERMIGQIEGLVAEIAALRADNDALRAELRDAVEMLQRASAALGTAGARPAGRARAARRVAAPADAPPRAAQRGRRRPASAARARGRATPDSVTPDVVRAAIGKLGTATAKQIADEISRAGVQVSGRAIRFLAPAAGARVEEVNGERRYRL
jgi:hypothetical protein